MIAFKVFSDRGAHLYERGFGPFRQQVCDWINENKVKVVGISDRPGGSIDQCGTNIAITVYYEAESQPTRVDGRP